MIIFENGSTRTKVRSAHKNLFHLTANGVCVCVCLVYEYSVSFEIENVCTLFSYLDDDRMRVNANDEEWNWEEKTGLKSVVNSFFFFFCCSLTETKRRNFLLLFELKNQSWLDILETDLQPSSSSLFSPLHIVRLSLFGNNFLINKQFHCRSQMQLKHRSILSMIFKSNSPPPLPFIHVAEFEGTSLLVKCCLKHNSLS